MKNQSDRMILGVLCLGVIFSAMAFVSSAKANGYGYGYGYGYAVEEDEEETETSDNEEEGPKIDHVSIRTFVDPATGKTIWRVTVKGENFDSNSKVKIEGVKAFKTRVKNGKTKIIAYFYADEINLTAKDKVKLRVKSDKEVLRKKIKISKIKELELSKYFKALKFK